MSDFSEPRSDDLREYYHSAPAEQIAFECIEIRHPTFVDDFGRPACIRVVNASSDLAATLEDDAPMNAGETVTFLAGRFDLVPPDSPDQGLPKATIAVDNVTSAITPYMQLATTTIDPVEITLREFLRDDLSEPASVINGLTFASGKTSLTQVQADLAFDDVLNAPFPDQIYRTDVYLGLVR